MPAFDDAMPLFDDRSIDTVHKAIIFEDVSIGFEDAPVLDRVSFELNSALACLSQIAGISMSLDTI
jgi:hypothetical protein